MAPLFKYPVMSGRSILSFGHPECLNLSIIDAMGYCSRIGKNVTDRQSDREQRTERPIIESPLIANGTAG